jgi:hypothetical protein
MNIEEEIKSVEKESMRLARKRDELLRLQQERMEREQQLEGIFAQSGYPTPLDLVQALICKFDIRVPDANRIKGKRKRTRVTAALRDAIRRECQAGLSMNRAAKRFAVSYAVVSKVLLGHYDRLSA